MTIELGPDHARVAAVDGDASVLKDRRQLAGEQDIGQLGLAVGAKELAVALFAHQILPVDAAKEMGRRADHHDAAGRALLEAIQQQVRKQKVTQMVDAQLLLVAVGGEGPGTGHHPGIVDQQVQLGLLRLEALYKVPHRLQGSQVQGAVEQLLIVTAIHDLQAGGLTASGIAAGHVDAGTTLGQLQDGLLADARVAAGDDYHLAIDPIGLAVDGALDALAQQPHNGRSADYNQEKENNPGPEAVEAEGLLACLAAGIEAGRKA